MQQLSQQLNQKYKYFVTCAIMEVIDGATLHSGYGGYWNKNSDCFVQVEWSNKIQDNGQSKKDDETKHDDCDSSSIMCVVTVARFSLCGWKWEILKER